MSSSTRVVQVTNVSPSTTSEQMRTLFEFLGTIEELKLFPPDDSPLPVTSRVCFVKFREPESVGVSQHLTNTVFVDRALIVVPFAEGVIPDESKAMSLLAPANALAGMMPGGGLLPTPNPLASLTATPFGGLGAPNLEQMAAMGLAGSSLSQQAISADFLKLMQSMDPKLSPLAAGLNLTPGLKPDSSNKEIEETMKKVREAQSLILDAIEPGSKKDGKHKRSRSRSRRKRSRSPSRHRRSRSRSRRRSHSRTSRSKRRSKSPRRRRTHSQDRGRRSRSRDRRKEEKSKKRSKTPPKSYSSARRSRSVNRRHRRSRSASRSPRRKPSRSPSPRRHKKEKKKDKDREKDRNRDRREDRDRDRSRDEQEHSTSKKKNKDKERDRDHLSDSEKGDVKVTRDYDEEEQGYDSEKGEEEDDERKSDSDSVTSPTNQEETERTEARSSKKSKLNGDDHHQEDMEMSD
ncbi:serine/arginine-rich splicing factor 11 [Austrofundulus limnaeus]|uniref:Serine/arginine-rich splicing factor 11 n=1 Tax=Austrofundulus limnaeus TaxID=52670 RepID=A0A2I4DBS8_AUSLI|nr:PREDICTED: serine/arginine-rich splicing factor 11-like [Austrofundulus limnaeus]